MRHSFLLLLLLNVFISFSQNKNAGITLNFENEELSVIFDSLSAKTGYFFSYNSDLLPSGNRFTITTKDILIDQFLSELLVGTGLKYSFFKEQIIINYESPPPVVKRKKVFNISGNVLDENSDPLVGVNIFLDGTTIGTSSDAEGKYFIDKIPPGNYNLVFSYIGYENGVYNLTENNGGSRIQDHNMILSVDQLDEIEVVSNRISNDVKDWPLYFTLFKNDLFGTSKNAKQCTITNPEVINFSYDETSNKLTAHTSAPINIVNKAMAYQITYFLESFERKGNDLRYRGQMKFQNNLDLTNHSKHMVKNERKKSYLGSWNHFKKSLLRNGLRKDGFRVYETRSIDKVNYKKLEELHEGDILVFKGDHWELEFNNYLLVVYTKEKESINFLLDGQSASVIYGDYIDENKMLNRAPGKQISLLGLLHGPVRIDLNGQVVDRFAISTYGYWSWERLANLVPINYDPKFDNFNN